MDGFVDVWFLLVEVLSLVAGIGLIVAPNKMYTFGNKDKEPVPPKNWPITSRIIGVFFIAMGVYFLYMRFIVGADMSI